MKSNPSLRNRILWYIIGISAFLVIIYSVLLEFHVFLGLEMSAKYMIETDVQDYAERYKTDQQTPLPSRKNLYVYRSIPEIPKPLVKLFPTHLHDHRKWDYLQTNLFIANQKKHPAQELKELCGGFLCDFIIFYSYQLHDKQWLYLVLAENLSDDDRKQSMERFLYVNTSIASLFLLIILSVAFILIRNIGKPIGRIANWADKLTIDDLGKSVPNFQYKELDAIAERLRGAFERIGQVLKNEHRFLRNASHELRTPIAVMSTNLSILDKLSERTRNSTEINAINRMKRSVLTMQQLIETLLWLSRDNERISDPEPIDIDKLIDTLIEENRYLLEKKQVDIQVNQFFTTINAPATLCRIVLTNLIRNAFQYTLAGVINIDIQNNSVTITNTCQHQKNANLKDADYGFGLGLLLVEQIADKLHWHFQSTRLEAGHTSSITFGQA